MGDYNCILKICIFGNKKNPQNKFNNFLYKNLMLIQK